ncbi:type I DNA topoisomerase [Rhodoplanes sp. TEM]|uniref:DNA topoisomerase 1 n=1 Tax=Rhodoplanes tepidamans TaxID=200616 RepID=A0ABT5J737_RHOTP|nr:MULTISPECIES: type I DNA topoisomerase [Rhodoplanes]MDC7785272.1 type I DNA topoisomerase [Rhodoplanes tepidamans]MDC7984661.1 type I DNA topoisomerase [Rhodoplanes sp. TEM]MDQ0353530.1 DNA topoisomerase-1 [Rhodoplanes tepidamans]
MNVVVVESPAKAKTINKYLGRGYEVLASFGHVRDLPPKDGSVNPDADFQMIWEVDGKAQKRIADIARALKGADKLILATDPDREGEAISWHLLEALREKRALSAGQPIERVVFNAITKQAVTEAMKHPRAIDQALVDAYLARRALDYLVGFTLSPVLWRKLPGARSAGRVQSVALRLVCDRELEIEKFVSQEYWSLIATLATPRSETFQARLVGADGKKITRLDIGSGAEAEAFKQALEAARYTVAAVDARPTKRNPQPPFTTSTLQQEASRKLGFAPAHTMRVAQRLYEGVDIDGETVGLITYMRTDGVQMAPEAIAAVRDVVKEDYGARYLPDSPRQYQTKAKNAQEAHEAIRPTDMTRRPRDIKRGLEPDQARLYELIYMRAVSSQMESAELERTTVDITANAGGRTLELRATGSVITFDGFLAVYQEGRDEDPEDEESRRLPAMSAGELLAKQALDVTQHFTEPPPRYSEASLVKRMEELGIGRPSTYASILQVLKDRSYVRLDKRRLVPEDRGRIVVAFLESFFSRYVEYDFTADLEEQLDRVSNAEIEWHQLLRRFWTDFTGAVDGIKDLKISEVIDALDAMLAPHIFPAREDGTDPRVCTTCGTGRLSLKLGRFGAFIGCSNYPDCRYTRPFSVGGGENGEAENKVLGQDPETGLDVSLRSGRFGPYIQLGEANGGDKPKRAGLPKGTEPASVDLEMALRLLSLPREIGKHPDDGEPILAGIGRFGSYVQHGKTYANLEPGDDVLTIGLNRAVTLIAEKREKGGKGRRFGGDPGRSLGDHPDQGGPIVVKAGRYGPYVSHNGINATLPKDKTPETITLAEAVDLIAARAEKTGGVPKRKAPARKAAAPKAAKAKDDGEAKPAAKAKAGAKKAPPKKAPAKKAAAKGAAKKPAAKAKRTPEPAGSE